MGVWVGGRSVRIPLTRTGGNGVGNGTGIGTGNGFGNGIGIGTGNGIETGNGTGDGTGVGNGVGPYGKLTRISVGSSEESTSPLRV